MTNKFCGSAKYGARTSPNSASRSSDKTPTIIGMIVNCPLKLDSKTQSLINQLPFIIVKLKNTYSSMTLAMYGKCISILCSSSSAFFGIQENLPVAKSSLFTKCNFDRIITNTINRLEILTSGVHRQVVERSLHVCKRGQ